MHYVYILKSEKGNHIYIGNTSDIERDFIVEILMRTNYLRPKYKFKRIVDIIYSLLLHKGEIQ